MTTSQGNNRAEGFKKRYLQDLMIMGLLGSFVVLLFWKTVVLGAPISKLHLLAEWDSVFSGSRTGQSYLIDPSAILLMVPYYFMVAQCWHSGTLPLWNSSSGLGAPLLADPQALALSPLHIPLYLFPSTYTYNCILVGELAILATGAYVMARTLRIHQLGAVMTASCLVLCPYEQWYLELLGNGYCLIPWLFAAFFYAASSPTITRSLLAGIACTVMILSAHPELSFCSILLASLSCLLLRISASPQRGVSDGFVGAAKIISLAGVTAFCTSAPMLLPFVEFLTHSESYKFSSGAPAYIPWQATAINLIHPAAGVASPFFGCIGFLLIVVALGSLAAKPVSEQEKESKGVTITLIILATLAIIISGKMLGLGGLLKKPPFTYLVVTYFFPAVLVYLSCLVGKGMDELAKIARSNEDNGDFSKRLRISLVAAASIAALSIWLFPLAVKVLAIDLGAIKFDLTLGPMATNSRSWLIDSILTAIGLIAIFVLSLKQKLSSADSGRKMIFATGLALLTINAASQQIIARKSLPVRPAFDYPASSSIEASIAALTESTAKRTKVQGQTKTGRLIATGEFTLKPNSNIVFDIPDLRQHNPIFPKPYVSFMKVTGARLDEFNQVYEEKLSPIINLASVNTILTPDAILVGPPNSQEESNTHQVESPTAGLVQWTADLESRLDYLYVDQQTDSVQCRVSWSGANITKNLYYFLSLLDKNGGVIWQSARQPVKRKKAGSVCEFAVPIDLEKMSGEEVTLTISLIDLEKMTIMPPPPSRKLNLAAIFATLPLSRKHGSSSPSRFQLLESTSDRHRVYRNNDALPQAYFVDRIIYTDSSDEALQALEKTEVQEGLAAVLERNQDAVIGDDSSSSEGEKEPGETKSGTSMVTSIARPNPTHLIIEAEVGKENILVTTDIDYPGWTATIDGATTPIMRANYAFRAIRIPIGKHRIVFSYDPTPFKIGMGLAIVAFIAILLYAGIRLYSRRNDNDSA